MMDYQKIGVLIYELRKEKNMTQKQLDNAIGFNNRTVCQLELGNYQPSLQKVVMIAKYFDVSIDDLVLWEI